MERIPFVITKEDYENSSKKFSNPGKCPFAIAANRVFKEVISVGVHAIFKGDKGFEVKNFLGEISPGFYADSFDELALKGKEFHTELILY